MSINIQDWERIGRAPVLVFASVATADGNTSKEEIDAFCVQWMPRLKRFKVTADELEHDLFQWALDEAASHWEAAIQMDQERLLRELNSVVRLMESRFTEQDALAWKAALLKLGSEVARSSGGFFGLANPVDATEQEVLSRIKRILQDTTAR